MKKTPAFIACLLFCLPLIKSGAQTLGTDALGNSPLLYPGVAATADLQRAAFSASYYNIDNSLYYRKSALLGMSVTGGDRGGMSSLINKGFTAPYASATITAGISFANNYINRYKPRAEYEKLLTDEQQRLKSRMQVYITDTTYIFGWINSLSKELGGKTDTLKQIYKETGPDLALLKGRWLQYGRLVKEQTGSGLLYDEVSIFFGSTYGENYFVYYTDLKKKLQQIELQLSVIDAPAVPFSRNILFLSLGINSQSINNLGFLPNATRPSFNSTNYGTGQVALGMSHHIRNTVFIGFQLGYKSFDNFETLTPFSYDSSRVVSNTNIVSKHTFNGYSGQIIRKSSAYFSFQMSLIENINGLGKAIITPVYFLVSSRSSIGASVQLVTNNNIIAGLNVDYTGIGGEDLIPKNEPNYAKLSVGIRIGVLLADFNFEK